MTLSLATSHGRSRPWFFVSLIVVAVMVASTVTALMSASPANATPTYNSYVASDCREGATEANAFTASAGITNTGDETFDVEITLTGNETLQTTLAANQNAELNINLPEGASWAGSVSVNGNVVDSDSGTVDCLADQTDTYKKVLVCMYVGTPGVDERRQTGQNPISVSINAIANNQWNGQIPGYFSDAHDRSYVLDYDKGQTVSIDDCPDPVGPPPPPPIECLEKPVFAYTGKVSGTITVTGGTAGQLLCKPLSIRVGSWTYDQGATQQPGRPAWPQTQYGYNDTLVDRVGTFSYGPPREEICGQSDAYASFNGFEALALPINLLGPNNPFEPKFLHQVIPGAGPSPTWSYTTLEGCDEGTYPSIAVSPETCDYENGAITNGSIVVGDGQFVKSAQVYLVTDDGIVKQTDTSSLPVGEYVVIVVFEDGYVATATDGWKVSPSDPAKASQTFVVEEADCEVAKPVITLTDAACVDGVAGTVEASVSAGPGVTTTYRINNAGPWMDYTVPVQLFVGDEIDFRHYAPDGYLFPNGGDMAWNYNIVVPDPRCEQPVLYDPVVEVTTECGVANVLIDYRAVPIESAGLTSAATANRTWEIAEDGDVIETVTLQPGESFQEQYLFEEDSSDGSVTFTVTEVGGQSEPTVVEVDTDCASDPVPPTTPNGGLAATGSEESVLPNGIALVALLIILGIALVAIAAVTTRRKTLATQ